MRLLVDHEGLTVRLTDERLAHILEHPEMAGLEDSIAETLARPRRIVQPASDDTVRLYYRLCRGTRVGDKLICVALKVRPGDAFVLTAYLTDKPKKGTLLWSADT